MQTWTTTSAEQTRALAPELLDLMQGKGLLLLEGDLGAGKTTLVQGLAEALGITEPVTSPTYGLVKEYGDPPVFLHADLYRLTAPEELWELGVEEWLDGSVLFAVEWPDRAGEEWPEHAWRLRFETDPLGKDLRTLALSQGGRK